MYFYYILPDISSTTIQKKDQQPQIHSVALFEGFRSLYTTIVTYALENSCNVWTGCSCSVCETQGQYKTSYQKEDANININTLKFQALFSIAP